MTPIEVLGGVAKGSSPMLSLVLSELVHSLVR
jgi:hypothetical protein